MNLLGNTIKISLKEDADNIADMLDADSNEVMTIMNLYYNKSAMEVLVDILTNPDIKDNMRIALCLALGGNLYVNAIEKSMYNNTDALFRGKTIH